MSAGKKKLLLISTRRFWPVDIGRKYSLYHYCRGLYERYNYEISVFSFLEAGQKANDQVETPYFIHNIEYETSISKIEIAKNIFSSFCFLKNWPLQCSLYFSKKNCARIKEIVESYDPNVIIVDMIRLAPYLKAISGSRAMKVLDTDDLLSIRYEQQLYNSSSRANITGNYSGHFSSSLNRFINSSFLRRGILKYEAAAMRKMEQYYGDAYDKVVLVSKSETEQLQRVLHTKNKVFTVTVGCDVEYYSEKLNVFPEEDALSFVGNFNTSANVDSLAYIIHDILPRIKQKVELHAIGKCPKEVEARFQTDSVKFTGMVDDLRTYVKKTHVFIAPIVYGSGIKTKIIEAMGMGMPVVTNSIGAEGLSVHNGRELFIADDPQELANITMQLLNDPELRKEIGRRGQQYVRENHDWNKIYDVFGEMGL